MSVIQQCYEGNKVRYSKERHTVEDFSTSLKVSYTGAIESFQLLEASFPYWKSISFTIQTSEEY